MASGFALIWCTSCATTPTGFFAADPRRHPGHGVWLRRVPNYPAPDPSVPWAALAMALTYWDRPARPAQVEARLRSLVPREGDFGAIERYVWAQGLWTHAGAGSMEALKARLAAGVPVIVRLRDGDRDRFAIAAGYNDASQEMLCHEGRRRPRRCPYEAFERMWRSGGCHLLLVCPPDWEKWPLSAAELFDRARYFVHHNHYELAARDLEAALALRPAEGPALVRLGNVRRLLGQREEAERLYREALRLDPQDAAALNNLAYLLAESGGAPEESVALARQAALLEPTNPVVLDTLGFAYLQAGRPREAADVLERARGAARSCAPEQQTEIALHLVRAHRANGDEPLARQVLADILRLDPGFAIPEDLRSLLR